VLPDRIIGAECLETYVSVKVEVSIPTTGQVPHNCFVTTDSAGGHCQLAFLPLAKKKKRMKAKCKYKDRFHVFDSYLPSILHSTKSLTRKTPLKEETTTRFPMEGQMQASSHQKEEFLVRTRQSLGQNNQSL
jgi:hypothetical protein